MRKRSYLHSPHLRRPTPQEEANARGRQFRYIEDLDALCSLDHDLAFYRHSTGDPHFKVSGVLDFFKQENGIALVVALRPGVDPPERDTVFVPYTDFDYVKILTRFHPVSGGDLPWQTSFKKS